MAEGLIDTNILIDVLRNHAPALQWIAQQGQLGVSQVVYLELLEGARDKHSERGALKLLQTFELVEVTSADFEWATTQMLRYHLSHSVGAFDCLIAAPAHRLQLPLYTHNLKHLAPLLGEWAQKPY